MPRVVVDTDVVSFTFKNDSRADLYAEHLAGQELVLSFMTVAELYRWAIQRSWGSQRFDALSRHVRTFLVYPFTDTLCLRWATVMDQRARSGRPIKSSDAWIEATAVEHRIPLVTHNRQDFEGIDGLSIISES
jgi:tRNA(fMet)-specific endonuclease VapC